MKEQGTVLKGIGSFYTVMTEGAGEVVAKARGRFRKDGVTPLCGDRVVIERQQEGDAAMLEILPRKNLLVRPPVANIDQIIIVLALSAPKPDLLLCDKLMLAADCSGIEPIVVFNKMDTVSQENAEALRQEYAGFYAALVVSAKTGEGVSVLSDILENKISCFAGQSAVGKSSLLNTLLPELNLPVGGLARRTDRGKHTTRHVELWPYRGGAVLDTPGFSLLEIDTMEQGQLNAAYREFQDAPERCRFAGCAHRSEPGCAVKELVGGSLSEGRYKRYLELSLQFEEVRKHKYD